MTQYTLSDFDFALPPELIAQTALEKRSASRLLEVLANYANADTVTLHDRQFSDISQLLRPGDLLVCNDTKVIKARLLGHKESGGAIEVLIERVLTDADGSHRSALAQIRASKSPKTGTRLFLGDLENAPLVVTVGERVEPFFTLHFAEDAYALLEKHGRLPLPPYITHNPDAYDETRYQTVFAKHLGAVAAPTAGLHFDDALFAALAAQGVQRGFLTLHVGAGTFQPVRTENLTEHQMHSEWFSISPTLVEQIAQTQARGGRVIAVGTTSLRALESAANELGEIQVGERDTHIFITPGYRFKVVDALITNFHLPKSTLLMLVSAFAGTDAIKQAYAHAIAQEYRFFSYGDAMFLQKSALA